LVDRKEISRRRYREGIAFQKGVMILRRALLINGSPHRNGNNALILDVIEKGLKENNVVTGRVEVSSHEIHPCIHCRECERQKGCVVQDDMTWTYEQLNRSDIIVVSCPIYFNGVSAQFKALVDRCQAIWASKYVLGDSMIDRQKERGGLFICTGGQPEGKSNFNGAVMVADMFFRVINVNKWDKLLISNVDSHPVKDRKDVLEQINITAKELAG